MNKLLMSLILVAGCFFGTSAVNAQIDVSIFHDFADIDNADLTGQSDFFDSDQFAGPGLFTSSFTGPFTAADFSTSVLLDPQTNLLTVSLSTVNRVIDPVVDLEGVTETAVRINFPEPRLLSLVNSNGNLFNSGLVTFGGTDIGSVNDANNASEFLVGSDSSSALFFDLFGSIDNFSGAIDDRPLAGTAVFSVTDPNAAVPEPSTLPIIGFACVAGWAKRQRRARG